MDFAKFVIDYKSQKTEGDPSYIMSEEGLAFTDMMRMEDLDSRARQVEQQTNADARGEDSHDSITSEPVSIKTQEEGDTSEPSVPTNEHYEEATPASVTPDVALGTEPVQAFISDGPENEQSEKVSGDGESANQNIAESAPDQDTQISLFFSEESQPAASNEQIQSEGNLVIELPNDTGETTIIAPESMPDFQSILEKYDTNYRTPEPPAGDDDMAQYLPPELEEFEPPVSSTDIAEQMLASMSHSQMAVERSRP